MILPEILTPNTLESTGATERVALCLCLCGFVCLPVYLSTRWREKDCIFLSHAHTSCFLSSL